MAAIVNMDRLIEATAPSAGVKITYEEFLTAYDSMHAEWVDGEVEIMSPVSIPHQQVVGVLVYAFGFYADAYGGQVLFAPVQMRLREARRGREPDVMFIREENQRQITKYFVDGPVDVAVEIISPDSVERDRVLKYTEYETAGVREYWIIDQDAQTCDFYILGNDGKYASAVLDESEIYHSAVLPGLSIDTRWFWRLRPPGPSEIMKAIDMTINEGA